MAGLALFFYSFPAHADAVANINRSGQTFPSADGAGLARVTFDTAPEGELAVTGRKRKWKLKLSRQVLRNFDFFPDEEGDQLVAILKASFLVGYKGPDGDPDALLFIHDGAVTRKYSYATLMKNPDRAWRSVSHTHWLFGRPQADFAKQTFTLMTNDGHRYRFSLPDGALNATETFDPEAERKKTGS